jgi:hypothetical protein
MQPLNSLPSPAYGLLSKYHIFSQILFFVLSPSNEMIPNLPAPSPDMFFTRACLFFNDLTKRDNDAKRPDSDVDLSPKPPIF